MFLVISGGIIRKFGYFKPNLVLGSCLATVGCGLIYTLELNSSAGRWIGYQILVGAGVGFGWQPALVASQASVKSSDMAVVTSTILCKISPDTYAYPVQAVLEIWSALVQSKGEK